MQRICLLALALVSACAPAPTATPLTTITPTIQQSTRTPSATAPPTATRTTADAIYPYTIEGLRKHEFRSGHIFLGAATLETDDFTRYAIEYPSDGITISGTLQIPKKGTPPFPVIVMNHGFFSRTVFSSGDGTDRAAEFLNRRGYLTIASDYRSWGKSESDISLFYSGLAIDVINLINALPSLPQADANRVGIWGHSMGGGVTLKVLTIDHRLRAAVLYSPVSADFEDIIDRWGPGCLGDVYVGEITVGCNSSDVLPANAPADLISAYFRAVTDPTILAEVSPINYFDFVKTPVQITYGTDDGKTLAGTPPEWSKKMYKAFLDANVNARLFGAEGGHSLVSDQWFAFMERSAQFFDKYVRPETSP